MKPLILSLLLVVTSTANLFAEVRISKLFADNMVLQREQSVPVWGWAEPGEEVTVTFAGQSKTAAADAAGRWRVDLDALAVSTNGRPFTVNDAITFKNVVVGDVWLCSGQSNMEWSLAQARTPAEMFSQSIPLVRHMKIDHKVSPRPMEELQVVRPWIEAGHPRTAHLFTAVGYFFARSLHEESGVPIGLIGSNWSGTRIEPWIAPEGFNLVPELQSLADQVNRCDPGTEQGKAAFTEQLDAIKDWLPMATQQVAKGNYPPEQPRLPVLGGNATGPTMIYNQMIRPIIPVAMKGVIWYQGESNGGEGLAYFHKKQALIKGWRQLWGQGDFPFYFVQLANFKRSPDNPAGGDGWARLREAQRQSLEIENTGMAVIIDIGEANDIHPKNKKDVGYRLARHALVDVYGKDMVKAGPLYKSHVVEGARIRLSFDYVGGGLIAGKKEGMDPVVPLETTELAHFAIAGVDKRWHWATAVIDGDTVVVSSPNVAVPVAVRYAYRMNPAGVNFYNAEGLPASPFRTDDW